MSLDKTDHRIIFGNCRNMPELKKDEIQLVITSPPYFNAPFDYPGLFKDYQEFLQLMKEVAQEIKRVLAKGRIAAIVTDDMLVDGQKYPIVADLTKIFTQSGFRYRDKIIWRKPDGYIRISRRSGVLIQHPYPMYFYPDNLQESILLFQKGKFNYQKEKKKLKRKGILEKSRIDIQEFQENQWYLTVWDITNVLPKSGRTEEGVAAFPAEIPYRIIKLFSYLGETVLDPFLGSGTVTKVAKKLGRNSVGYEVDLELKDMILEKIDEDSQNLTRKELQIAIREDHERCRTFLQNRIKRQESVTK